MIVGRAVRHSRVAASNDHVLGAVGSGSNLSRWCRDRSHDGCTRCLSLELTITDLVDQLGGSHGGASREGSEGD